MTNSELNSVEPFFTRGETVEREPRILSSNALDREADIRRASSNHTCNQEHWSDADLIVAAQDGALGAMEQLLVRHRNTVYRAARRLSSDSDAAEDLVQEAMMRAFMNVRKFRRECQFSTWLVAIVKNSALSKKRKGRGLQWVYLDDTAGQTSTSLSFTLCDRHRNPEQETIRQELLQVLQGVFRKLPSKHQAILKACVLDEEPIEDAARALGLTIGSAKSHLYRARRRLSERFGKRGIAKGRSTRSMLFPASASLRK